MLIQSHYVSTYHTHYTRNARLFFCNDELESCYVMSFTMMSRSDARNVCQRLIMDLAAIETIDEGQYLTTLVTFMEGKDPIHKHVFLSTFAVST